VLYSYLQELSLSSVINLNLEAHYGAVGMFYAPLVKIKLQAEAIFNTGNVRHGVNKVYTKSLGGLGTY
jgi:hypothetical protein